MPEQPAPRRADEWRVALPEGAAPPYRVFLNGVAQQPDRDYRIDGRWLCFDRPLTPKPPLGGWRKLVLSLGIGVYGDLTADVVDLQFTRGGTRASATNLPIIPPPDPPRGSPPPS